jgi:glucose-1-phosphate thymidylyltransferase
MKGIILAGGSGTRLYPVTQVISKQLLPVYDKPMIYYPLSILMLAGIKEILIISTIKDIPLYKELFGDGSTLGLSFTYLVQEKPNGLAEAFVIGSDFIGNDSVCLILGDNILYGENIPKLMRDSIKKNIGATIFGYYVNDPSSYGVVEFNNDGKVISIEEKPSNPKSNYAIPGLYLFDNNVINFAKKVKPSPRGELEIIDVINGYLSIQKLYVEVFGRGVAWLDSGTIEDLNEAANFISVIEKRQGLKIACIEEIAYRMNFIDLQQLEKLSESLSKSQYGKYLLNIIKFEKYKNR